jgi:putative membrane protein
MNNWWPVLIILILIIVIIVVIIDGTSIINKSEKPLFILEKRYANGEIDDDEYIRRKNILQNKYKK